MLRLNDFVPRDRMETVGLCTPLPKLKMTKSLMKINDAYSQARNIASHWMFVSVSLVIASPYQQQKIDVYN